MRFTKIPLIATLMAVALSLLIVLPAIAQTTDITDGKRSSGSIAVGVFDNIADAQLAKLVASTFTPAVTPTPYIPVSGTPAHALGTEGQHGENDAAYLADRRVDPQNTSFRNTLYVSNDGGAYNTVLINVRNDVQDTETCKDAPDAADAKVTATVKNNRSGNTITLELVSAGGGGGDSVNAAAGQNSQAFFKVVEKDATIGVDYDNDANTPDTVVPFREHGGPTWCDDDDIRQHEQSPDDNTPDLVGVEVETAATSAVYAPVQMPGINDVPLAGDPPPVQQEIATIFATHGDRLTVTTSGGSGQVELVVDGEGPEFSAVTPVDNSVTRGSRLTFSFEVRDDDSGLRHDGESVISNDGDYEEINPDGDQHLSSEPLSKDPGTAVPANGAAQDIDVNVKVNARSDTDTTAYDDISASGTWRIAGSRAGVAYAFTASGADRGDDEYLYQVEATDRAGNTEMTDAETDSIDSAEPYVFRVDDTEPDLGTPRTGITYDTEKNTEKVDRSYVALDFGADALGDVDTDNITVVGHTIVGFIHPSKAPRINRGESEAAIPPTGTAVPDEPETVVAEPTAPTSTDTTFGDVDGGTLTLGVICSTTNPATAIVDTTDANYDAENPPTIAPEDTVICEWRNYHTKKAAYDLYVTANTAYVMYTENKAQYDAENPGADIEGNPMPEPRSRIYLELAEDLAADAEPDVVVVGGAVFDLAGNTNDAKTVEAVDWIAPSLTVTVTGTANDRPIVNEDGSFSVDVRSDEDLNRRPTVYFVSITATQTKGVDTPDSTVDDEYTYAIDDADEASPLTQQEDENHWAKKYKRSSIDISVGDANGKLIGIVLLGEDGEDNSGATAGWTPGMHQNAAAPAATNKLNLVKLGGADLLLEIDEEFNDDVEEGIGEVTPRSDDKGKETESSNPFVKLSFDKEDGEYTLDGFKDADSHDTVTVTEITLNGDDVMANLNRVSATQFSLVLRDLAVDSYKVEYVAEDEAGNEMDDGVFSFEVNERQPYEIEVQPGWNLISLPATPVESAIGAVLANNQYISPVLGYQQGDWITAIREEDGTWRGRLETIDGGYGYWLHARTFESIETMLSQVDPAGTLPTVPVTSGWNLLGVLDIFQNDMDDPPGEKGTDGFAAANYDADNYFSSIPWKVAYTYDTRHSLWTKAIPEVDDPDVNEIMNGKGYWVWSPTPSTLVP